MRIVVTGSRYWPYSKRKQIERVIDPYILDANQLAQGGADGVDKIAAQFWNNNLWDAAFEYPADWGKHGKRAGFIRNKEMLEDFQPDIVLAFLIPTLECRGTWDCIEQAQGMGIEVRPFRLK